MQGEACAQVADGRAETVDVYMYYWDSRDGLLCSNQVHRTHTQLTRDHAYSIDRTNWIREAAALLSIAQHLRSGAQGQFCSQQALEPREVLQRPKQLEWGEFGFKLSLVTIIID